MRWTFTILLLAITCLLHGQELSYKPFTGKDGLPGSVVYHTIQDKKGFIWFATKQGVSCFDGRSFRNYTKEDGLPDNDIIKLYLDKYNNVWCISFVGIPAVFHNDTIIRFDQCTGVTAITEDLLTDSILLIAETWATGSIMQGYYGSSNHPGKWDFKPYFGKKRPYADTGRPVLRNSSPEKINFRFSANDLHTFSLCIDSGNATQCHNGKRAGAQKMSFYGNNSFSCLTENKRGILFNADGTIYYATFQRMTPVITVQELGLNTWGDINSLFCENDSTLWICTRNKGLLRISDFLNRHRRIQSFFDQRFCTSILKDQEQGYWVTTQGDGVYYLPNLSFYSLTGYPDLLNKNVLCIVRSDKPALLAGFADGNLLELSYFPVSAKRYASWSHQNKNNRILHIWPLPLHAFLLSCDNGLYKQAGHHTTLIRPLAAKELYGAGDTVFFLGSSEGVYRLNRAFEVKEQLFGNRVTCLTGTGAQLYWGTLHGVYGYRQGTVEYYGKQYPALANIINHLAVAADSSLWVSTQQGLFIVKQGIITAIGREQGMLSNMCRHISFENNIAWVATDKGITRISYSWQRGQLRYSLSNITEEDGLPANEVNQTMPAGGYVWAATARGISWFPKDYTSRPVLHPLINITSIRAGGQALPLGDTVKVDYGVRPLLIGLSGITYRSGKQVRYEYRLQGVNNNWSSTQNNTIEFSALPFGAFTFEVRAIDKWGVRSDQAARLVIIHPPPFWKTTWFLVCTYLIMALLLGTGFYVYHHERQRKQEKEYRLRKKMHELEMMALRAQMNPHFIFNCLTSIQYHIMRADIRSAHIYLHKFSTLIRQILQHSTDSTISLYEEIKILELYLELEKLRLGGRMDYRLSISDELKRDDYSIPTMIIQPHLENAVKHGIAPLQHRKGILTVDIRKSGAYIEVVIEDNGPGIHASGITHETDEQDHISMGTGITINRIHALNALQKNKILWQVTDKQQLEPGPEGSASGTIIHLSFPITPN
ncbi:hypothetical protein D3H65_04335 [Paraflavitalea soli]|uniref:Signal transduction histidine kinase internal region domain-containing protein n=1 Tax=Paraflavitalea soli TaxID=2315862 RepID=A0A3B7MJE2_9BACT|nr:histidine kinase [Paraflavitalea soli]AXY73250.1 hypothetical protein D3H65_04335 [Paraflavitalea soli]